jgi:hypothetical protein
MIALSSCSSTTACRRASMLVTSVSPGDAGGAGQASQEAVVAALESRAADERAAVERVVLPLVGRVELVAGDGRDVAEQVRGVDAEGSGIVPDAALLDDDGGEVLALLLQRDRHLFRHVLGHGHRLVGRAVPADAGRRRSRLAAELGPSDDLPVLHPKGVAEAFQDRHLGGLVELTEPGPVDRDHPGRTAGRQRAPLGIDDEPALRLHHDVLDGVVGRLGAVGVAAVHLDHPQAPQQRREQGDQQHLHDHQARADDTGCAHAWTHRSCAGSIRLIRAITGGTTRTVTARS